MKERAPRRPSPFKAEVTNGQERYKDLLSSLQEQVEAVHDDASFRKWLDVQSRFHQYSFGNIALIMAQRPDATQVAGYRTWQKLDRQVMKGEKAIKIIYPMTIKTGAVNAVTGEEDKRLAFGVGNVFDVSQTDGKPLPEAIKVPVLEGDEGGILYDDLARIAGQEDLRIDLQPAKLGQEARMGSFNPLSRRITLREDVSQLQRTKTLAHELAHYFTGMHETYGEFRAEHEAVAEASAYVTLKHFGLDSAMRSVPYIASWTENRDRFRQVLGSIQGVAHTLISRIEGPDPQTSTLTPTTMDQDVPAAAERTNWRSIHS